MTNQIRAQVRLPTRNLREDLPFMTDTLCLDLDTIYPADNPQVAILSGHGIRIQLEEDSSCSLGQIEILVENPDDFAGGNRKLVSPGGTKISINELDPPLVVPETKHAFVVRRLADQAPWVVGRAGMEYRDLIPSRLGGAMIASHIRVPDGPVPDMVHFHKVGFQLIFCVRGWVDVLYEDQGDTRRLHAGDCFIQPPEIRHKVLHAADGIEVVEIGVPAEHVTEIDHLMKLPTTHHRPEREWDGQRFVHSLAKEGTFKPFRIPGFEARDTTINENTKGVASVLVARPDGGTTTWTRHQGDIVFNFVISGEMVLEGEGQESRLLTPGDAFVIPPNMTTRYSNPTDDLQLMEVALPGTFQTETKGLKF